jgi:hypothetical protein
MPSVDVNVVAVLLCAVVNMVVGAVWYSPALFANEWSRLVGRKTEDMRKNAGTGYALTTLGALVQAWIMASLIAWALADSVVEGATVGFMLWLGFVAIPQGVNTVFAGGRKKLWAINTGYFLVVLLINGAILATVR